MMTTTMKELKNLVLECIADIDDDLDMFPVYEEHIEADETRLCLHGLVIAEAVNDAFCVINGETLSTRWQAPFVAAEEVLKLLHNEERVEDSEREVEVKNLTIPAWLSTEAEKQGVSLSAILTEALKELLVY